VRTAADAAEADGRGGYADAEGLPLLTSLGEGSLLKTGTACAGDGLAVALATPASLRDAMLAKLSGSDTDLEFLAGFSEPFLAGVFFGVGTAGMAGEPVRFSQAIAEPRDGNISSSNTAPIFVAVVSSAALSRVGAGLWLLDSAAVALGLRGVC
jgi:hypothetical protein